MEPNYHDIMKTKQFLPYKMGYINDTIRKLAKEELGENEKIKEESLSALRKMIKANPKFNIFTCEQHLMPYLRTQKFNVKKAYKLLENAYQLMHLYPELYRTNEEAFEVLNQIWQTGVMAWQPYRDDDGCPLLILRLNRWDPDGFPITNVLQAATAAFVFALDEEATSVTGIRVMFDVQGASLKHIRTVTVRYMQLLAKGLKNCFPIRIKGVHIFNDSVWFQYIYGIFKLFLAEKIKKRIHFHGDSLEDLHKIIPKEILPTEYGGLNDTDSDTKWFPKLIEQYYDTIQELYQYGFIN